MAELILVADIGGTNARFALAERDNGAVSVRQVKKFRAEDFETLRDAAGAYLEAAAAALRLWLERAACRRLCVD